MVNGDAAAGLAFVPGLLLGSVPKPRTKRRRNGARWVVVAAAKGGAGDGRNNAMTRVAVVGGGLAGVSISHRLLCTPSSTTASRGRTDHREFEVVIYDRNPIAEGNASAAAAGLLHKFTPRLKKAFRADEAFARADQVLMTEAPEAVVQRGPILRLAKSKKQQSDYRKAAESHPEELQLLAADELRGYIQADQPQVGVLIRDTFLVDVKLYLRTLWAKCKAQGRASWSLQNISSADALLHHGFDHVVIAAGHRSGDLVPNLPLDRKQGRTVIFSPQDDDRPFPKQRHDRLSLPLLGGKYVVPMSNGCVLAGATMETESSPAIPPITVRSAGSQPFLNDTLLALGDRIYEMYPPLRSFYEPTTVTCGVRAIPIRPSGSSPYPFLARSDANVWVFTGLASRGLLHHTLLADLLADAIRADDSSSLPPELHL